MECGTRPLCLAKIGYSLTNKWRVFFLLVCVLRVFFLRVFSTRVFLRVFSTRVLLRVCFYACFFYACFLRVCYYACVSTHLR